MKSHLRIRVRSQLIMQACPIHHRVPTGKTILVPLTNSLYVPGKLSDPDNVIVDVGTGYYVKKVCAIHESVTAKAKSGLAFASGSTTGSKALPSKSGVYSHKSRDATGYNTEETRQHELLGQHNAGEATGTNSSCRQVLTPRGPI